MIFVVPEELISVSELQKKPAGTFPADPNRSTVKVAHNHKMRRSQGYNYQPLPQAPGTSNDLLEDENQRMADELQDKIGALKSLSIDIGNEVKYQDKLLRGIDDDMDRTGGFLGTTMSRVIRLGKNGHQKYMCYMFLFALFVMLVLYFVIKLR